MIDKNLEFNDVELSKLNIHELRDLAREIGVISPTLKSKGELINSILSIIYGEVNVEVRKSGAGRPVRTKTKPSKLLFKIDEENLDLDSIDNPFVKKYSENPESIFKTGNDNGLENNDVYDFTFINPYSSVKVASPKSEYSMNDGEDDLNEDFETSGMSPKLLELGRRVRELLGRETEEDKKHITEPEEKLDVKGCLFVSGYVFEGALGKLYVAYPELDEVSQVVYVIPEKLCKLFAIKVGDFLEGWADKNLDTIVNISAINGNVIF